MRQTVRLFLIGLRQMARDGMLFALLPATFLTGLFFKLAVPFMNRILEDKLSFSIQQWYGHVDGMLVCLTPMFTAMITAFLLLDERDEGIGAFYQVTPAGGYPYLIARIGIPMVWSFLTTVTALLLFNISALSLDTILLSSIVSALSGVFLAMMVVSIAGNRVEGLALSKLMGVSFLGLIMIWFVPAPYHYIGAFLPSFWIGKLLMEGTSLIVFVMGVLSCLLWIAVFVKRFVNRMD